MILRVVNHTGNLNEVVVYMYILYLHYIHVFFAYHVDGDVFRSRLFKTVGGILHLKYTYVYIYIHMYCLLI